MESHGEPNLIVSVHVPGQPAPLERTAHEFEVEIPMRRAADGSREHANAAAVMFAVQWSGDDAVDMRIAHAVAVAKQLLADPVAYDYREGFEAGRRSGLSVLDDLRGSLAEVLEA